MKLEVKTTKVYKPEILECPICHKNLKYSYTVSNKIIQFTSGKTRRIKNMGYSCPYCKDNRIYFSLTANKFAFKGYTYSAKIVCMVDYYKEKEYSRDKICDILASHEVLISDRNIDILYNKFISIYNQDYDSIIKNAYQNMIDEFGFIRLSIDYITINEINYVIIYDYFKGNILSIFKFFGTKDPKMKETLSKYISNYPIKLIITVRGISAFLPLLKSIAPKDCKFISYLKF